MGTVTLEEHDGWSEVRLADPGRRNALSAGTVEELLASLARAAARSEVVLLSAEGPVFCAGADRSESHLPSAAPSTHLLDALVVVEAHLVALVEGPAVGAGAALAACCPVVVAEPTAWFSLPEASLGRFGAGPAPLLEAVLPARTVHDLALTGRRLAADEARAGGLVSHLADAGRARDRAVELVVELAARPVVARQARWWWQQRFRTEEFRTLRRSALELLDRDHGGVAPDEEDRRP